MGQFMWNRIDEYDEIAESGFYWHVNVWRYEQTKDEYDDAPEYNPYLPQCSFVKEGRRWRDISLLPHPLGPSHVMAAEPPGLSDSKWIPVGTSEDNIIGYHWKTDGNRIDVEFLNSYPDATFSVYYGGTEYHDATHIMRCERPSLSSILDQ